LKSWQLNRKIKGLSGKLEDSAKTQTRFDYDCFSEPERKLLDKVQEIIDKYAPASPPQDVIEKNSDLWYKGLEIFGRRATELFVDVMPASICCDELEEWYFKIYFYNFLLDWIESVKELREMPKEKRDALILERKQMGLLDRVFRLHRSQPEAVTKQKAPEKHPI
jgi:hypothetical protein